MAEKLPKGVHFDRTADKYSVHLSVPTTATLDPKAPTAPNAHPAAKSTKRVNLHFEDAEEAGRAYDCIELLLQGPFACHINHAYDSYTQADLRAVAEKLHTAGVDVHAAIACVQRGRGACAWSRVDPGPRPGEWLAPLQRQVPRKGDDPAVTLTFDLGPFPDPRAAAKAADAARLVLQGPHEGRHPCLNFPLDSYSGEDIQAARAALVARMEAMHFDAACTQQGVTLLELLDKNIRGVGRVGALPGGVVCLQGAAVIAAIGAVALSELSVVCGAA
jgi:hypothetical protein